ncbi:MAG: hypothetical protein WC413_04040 [Candidatus Nanoarchaeia archaeon]
MKIAICGSGEGKLDPSINIYAKEIGKEIAKNKCILLTGGCGGLPHEAACGAEEVNGKIIVYSPAINLESHIKDFNFKEYKGTEYQFMPENYKDDKLLSLQVRSLVMVYESNFVIVLGGQVGTMGEFNEAYTFGRNIGVLEKSGGITNKLIPSYLKEIKKSRGSKVIFEPNPNLLVIKMIEMEKNELHR